MTPTDVEQPTPSGPRICEACGHNHPPMVDCLSVLKRAILGLLLRVGDASNCAGCGQPIIWVRHTNGKKAPYTQAGQNHFIDCPKRGDFRRPK